MPNVEGYRLDQSQKVHVGTEFVRDDGAPATPDVVTHTSTIADAVTVISDDPPAGGFTIVPLITRGPFQVQLDYDADLGAGTESRSALFGGEIIGGVISGVNFVPGTPEPK